MKNFTFRKELVEAQDELLRFAYKLTMDIDEANDLLQETSLKHWTMKTSIYLIRILEDGCTPLCAMFLSTTTAK